ncbi:MAG TPA: FkbM family methyltransferase [Solirubrobacterales bacterium]
MAATRLLDAFAAAYPRAFFIEIGANDGVEQSHLRPYIERLDWRGVMVEPAPAVFERLRRNYAAHAGAVAFENAAITDRDGTVPFYELVWADEDSERVLDVFGSVSPDAVERSGSVFVPDENRRVVRSEVRSLTFASLCRRHRVDVIDLLVIDTEGYDHEVLAQVDLERYRPALVVYEHLFMGAEQREECRVRLERLGYETLSEQRDTWCLDPRADEGLTRLWRRLRPAVPADTIGG